MSTVAHIVSHEGVISLMLDGKSHSVNDEHPNYKKIKEALRSGDHDSLRTLVDIPKALVEFATTGKVEIKGGEVLYNGIPIHTSFTDRILSLMAGGFPFKPMLKFLENLMENPSSQSVRELYDFLQHRDLPITEDGCFLAYKGTRSDGKDVYSGTIDNTVGAVIEMPRNQVDDRREHTCSFGYHVGAMEYVRGYCTDRVVIVKVNPRDAVSVPTDHDAQKLRVCRYEVVGLYAGDLDAGPLYHSDGSEFKDWDDEEDHADVCAASCKCLDCEPDCDEKEWDVSDNGCVYYSRRDPVTGRFTK